LGAATVLCVDKTGTLTLNRMAVRKLFTDGQSYEVDEKTSSILPEAFHELLEFATLASHPYSFDPMERALAEVGERILAGTERIHRDWIPVQDYPLSQALLAMSRVWTSPGGEEYAIAAKGAPEAIADLCHLDQAGMHDLSERIESMADEGLRVIGVARAYFKGPVLPVVQHDFHFQFLGLIGFVDPVRAGVAEAVRECYSAGVRVIMITGDHAGTAVSVSREIGLTSLGGVITGPQLAEMGDLELRERIGTTAIFARTLAEQKLRIVDALKANGEVVAMTGDGINDAPALKSAHIGIAMGGRGTDVAREASSLVLVNDDFLSIVEAIKAGRGIFDNLRKAIAYIFAVHIPIVAVALVPVALGWPLILLPLHIVFLEMIIDPACSVAFEAEPVSADVMRRPPRGLREPLFDRATIGLGLAAGAIASVIALGVLVMSLLGGMGEAEARAMTFTTLIIANVGLILTNRSATQSIVRTLQTPNTTLWLVVVGAAAFLGLTLYVPMLRDLFQFGRLSVAELALAFIAGLMSIVVYEGLKICRMRGLASACSVLRVPHP